jgi:signal transduction histidine kinase
MAHEIKNPLAAIKGMTQVLPENLSDPDFIQRYEGVVLRQIDRINGLVEKLLSFGQPPTLTLSAFSIDPLVNEPLALLEDQCRKKNIRIVKESGSLPEVEGDAEQLSQVFMNLILNAVQAMPRGGTLFVKANLEGARIMVKVSDTGAGIPPGELDKVFDPFFTTKAEGSGMGLAVAYRIVKDHGGDIIVESDPGKGAAFTLWLPIKQKPSA